MNLCQDKNGTIYFGEYFANPERKPVNIYKTNDYGNSWQIAYTFPQNTINHIHGIFRDPFTERLWIATGDLDDECMIAYSEDGFQSITPFCSGKQEYRACILLFFEDRVIYATDSQYVRNSIKEIDKATVKITDLCEIKVSGIYGGRGWENCLLFQTTSKPSIPILIKILTFLFLKTMGNDWKKYYTSQKKRSLPQHLPIQFGSIRLTPLNDQSVNDVNLIISGGH